MKIKKYLIVFVIIFPLITFAQTTNSTVAPNDSINKSQDQIQLLQAQVVDLQNQVQSLKLELKFSRVLRQGSTGDDVKQLQEFLKTFTNAYPEGSIDGHFGPLTKAAVKEFQKQNGIGSDGIAGSNTQKKLNVLTAAIPTVTPCINCQQTTVSIMPPVTSGVSASGTLMLPAPTSIATGLNVSLASNNPFSGPLEKITTPPAVPAPVLAVNLTAGNDSAMTVSGLRFHEKGVIPDSSILDAYLVENGKVLYKYSSISSGVIDFDGLSLFVAAGQMRTMWLVIEISGGLSVRNTVSFGLNAASDVTARDASNKLVTASGSFPVIGNIFTAISASHLTWGTPDPSTYSQPSQSYYGGEVGPATPVIPAVSGGPAITTPSLSATACKTPTGVQVQPNVVTVLSPNGGEQWQIGETYTIKYSAKNIAGNKALLIYLEKGYDAPTTKTGANSRLLIGVTTNLESYTYKVPQNIQLFPGLGNNYKITIMVEDSFSSCDVIQYIGDSSDATFSIMAGSDTAPTVTTATIVNLSPTTYPPGCFSTMGYSTTTGQACDGSTPTTSASPVPTTSPTIPATPSIPIPTITTSQEKMSTLQTQINAVQNQLNNTIDAIVRDSLMAQIAALKTQIQTQTFQNNPVAPTIQSTAVLQVQVDKLQTTSTTTSPTP